MINKENFVLRLERIIKYYGFSASSFAEKIGVQRSSISHILSGRNNPSLEFIMKMLSSFPEIDLYWLLNGKGTFPAQEKSLELISENKRSKKLELENSVKEDKKIKRIVIFYSDGSFEDFEN